MTNRVLALIIYVVFFALIGFTVYITKSVIPIFLLIFSPDIEISEGEDKDKDKNES